MFRTISNKLAIGAMAVTMSIVVILGVVSYLFTRWNIQIQLHEKLVAEASSIGNGLDSSLSTINNNLNNLSKNLIIVNALVDYTGRDIYIEPFMKSYKLPNELPFILTLCDFEGKPIIGSYEPLTTYSSKSLLVTVIDEERPFAEIKADEDVNTLVLAYPVFYGATGRAEGILVLEVPFAAIVHAALERFLETPGRVLTITAGGRKIWQHSHDAPPLQQALSVLFQLDLPAPLQALALRMEYGEPTETINAPLRKLTASYLLIAVLVNLVTLGLSRYIAHRLTFPLMTLSAAVDKVAKTGMPQAHIEVTSDDEVQTLAASFNTMLEKLRESHVTLEQRVEERTRELAKLNEKLRNYADTQSELLREVNHRVKNNLTAIISMLHQEEDRAQDEGMEEFGLRLQEVVGRISGLLVVHSLLSSSRWTPLSLSFLCDKIIHAAMKGIALKQSFTLEVATAREVYVNSDQAHYLAIVLNELATNSLKYALRGKDTVAIQVYINEQRELVEVSYHDDGPGYPSTIIGGEFAKNRIGIPLIFGITRKSLRGEIHLANDQGATTRLTFPKISVATQKDNLQ